MRSARARRGGMSIILEGIRTTTGAAPSRCPELRNCQTLAPQHSPSSIRKNDAYGDCPQEPSPGPWGGQWAQQTHIETSGCSPQEGTPQA